MKKIIIVIAIILSGCGIKNETKFSEKALKDTFVSYDGETLSFQNILDKYTNKTIIIDVWASWCRDCIKSLPDSKKLQEEYSEVAYIHLSLDQSIEKWKSGIERYGVKGEHYFMQSGWEGDFGSFLQLNWIPRYLVVNKNREIEVFNAVTPTDKLIKKTLEK